MNLRSFFIKFGVLATLALPGPWAWGQDGLQGAWSRANLASSASLRTPFLRTLAAADFDGDNKPDAAVLIDPDWTQLKSRTRTIELHFTGRLNTDLTFESDDPTLVISALDVNRDGATDIVVEQPFTHKRLQVWLNEGRGGFRKVRIEDFPSTEAGNCQRLEFSSQRPEIPVLCLAAQRGSEVALPAICHFLDSSSSDREPPPLLGLSVGSRVVSPSSPRAPPLKESAKPA